MEVSDYQSPPSSESVTASESSRAYTGDDSGSEIDIVLETGTDLVLSFDHHFSGTSGQTEGTPRESLLARRRRARGIPVDDMTVETGAFDQRSLSFREAEEERKTPHDLYTRGPSYGILGRHYHQQQRQQQQHQRQLPSGPSSPSSINLDLHLQREVSNDSRFGVLGSPLLEQSLLDQDRDQDHSQRCSSTAVTPLSPGSTPLASLSIISSTAQQQTPFLPPSPALTDSPKEQKASDILLPPLTILHNTASSTPTHREQKGYTASVETNTDLPPLTPREAARHRREVSMSFGEYKPFGGSTTWEGKQRTSLLFSEYAQG